MLLAGPGPLIVLVFRTLPQTKTFKAEIKNVDLYNNNHTFIKIVFLTKSPKVIGVEGCPGDHHQECTVYCPPPHCQYLHPPRPALVLDWLPGSGLLIILKLLDINLLSLR